MSVRNFTGPAVTVDAVIFTFDDSVIFVVDLGGFLLLDMKSSRFTLESASIMDEGSVLLFLNGPVDRLEFSLNGVFGRTASKFEGFHSVPCGDLHFVSYRLGNSGEGAFTSLILTFDEPRVVVFEWSREEELFKIKTDERFEAGMMDQLLKYPGLIGYERFMDQQPESLLLWKRFTRCITRESVSKVFSNVSLANDCVFEVTTMLESHHSLLQGLNAANNSHTSLQFTKILSLKDYSKIPGISSIDVTKCAMDRSAIFKYSKLKISDLLSELQVSFLLLTFAQNFEGFEQWLDIVSLLFQSFEIAKDHFKDYRVVFEVVQEHLEMCPDDFFTGLMNENKLYRLLSDFFSNTDNVFEEYEKFYETKFGWSFEALEDEDSPVIVNTFE